MLNIKEIISEIISKNKVVLFMKGTDTNPQCGFSATVLRILQSYGVAYKTIDVLADSDIRQGIKDYTNWPTIPQLYISGEFIGGCDIVKELYENGDLEKKINK